MGTGASTSSNSTVISPRVEAFSKKHEPVLLDSPVLLDLSHGTIRYRLPDEKTQVIQAETSGTQTQVQSNKQVPEAGNSEVSVVTEEKKPNNIKTGYFYHPRLGDYSEDAEISQDESFKFYYVFKGPPKTKNKKLYYVYGKSNEAKDEGIKHEEYRPKGKGYDWPESYRKANNLYYDLTFLGPDEEGLLDSDSDGESEITSTSEHSNEIKKSDIKLKLHDTDTVESLKMRLTLVYCFLLVIYIFSTTNFC